MLRITRTREEKAHVVRVAGRLDADHLGALEDDVSAIGGKLALDLSELQSIDRKALHWLRRTVDRGVEIRGESPYISLLLERAEHQEIAQRKDRR